MAFERIGSARSNIAVRIVEKPNEDSDTVGYALAMNTMVREYLASEQFVVMADTDSGAMAIVASTDDGDPKLVPQISIKRGLTALGILAPAEEPKFELTEIEDARAVVVYPGEAAA